jgi:hypothetical protein
MTEQHSATTGLHTTAVQQQQHNSPAQGHQSSTTQSYYGTSGAVQAGQYQRGSTSGAVPAGQYKRGSTSGAVPAGQYKPGRAKGPAALPPAQDLVPPSAHLGILLELLVGCCCCCRLPLGSAQRLGCQQGLFSSSSSSSSGGGGSSATSRACTMMHGCLNLFNCDGGRSAGSQ